MAALLGATYFLTFCFNIAFSTLLPEGHTVAEGETVEFHCEVDDYGTLDDIDWVFTWASDNVGLYIEAETTGVVGPSTSAFLKEDHGIYRTFYNRIETEFGRIHNCTLRIENVQKGDEGRYNCAYYRRSNGGGIYEQMTTTSAHLRVLVPPSDGYPKCEYLATPHNITEDSWRGARVKLTCISEGGDPLAMLSWYRNNKEISSPEEVLNTIEYEMAEDDNGRRFVCVAKSPAIKEYRNCSVIPFQIPLSITLDSSVDVVPIGESLQYICRGQGLPEITGYSWLIGHTQVSEDQDKRFKIQDIKHGSILTIYDILPGDNSSVVTCKITNSNGLSAVADAQIQVLQANVETSSFQTMPIVIGVIASLVSLLILLALGLLLFRKRVTNNETTNKEDKQKIHLGEYEREGSIKSFKYEVNGNTSPTKNEEFAYANVNEKDRLILTSSTAYEFVQPKKGKAVCKQMKNVEGLEYADLDLPTPVDDSVILNPSANEMVTYSEFTTSVN